jgi:hypothetical protein
MAAGQERVRCLLQAGEEMAQGRDDSAAARKLYNLLNCHVLAEPGTVTLGQLAALHRETEGEEVPWRELGHRQQAPTP